MQIINAEIPEWLVVKKNTKKKFNNNILHFPKFTKSRWDKELKISNFCKIKKNKQTPMGIMQVYIENFKIRTKNVINQFRFYIFVCTVYTVHYTVHFVLIIFVNVDNINILYKEREII